MKQRNILLVTLSLIIGIRCQQCGDDCFDDTFSNTSCLIQKDAGLCESLELGAKYCPCTCGLCDFPKSFANNNNSAVQERKISIVDRESQFEFIEDTIETPALVEQLDEEEEEEQEDEEEVGISSKVERGGKCSKGRPNFLIIMTDDQGHDDISFYNNKGILHTPNMDKLAAESVQFENFYTDSLCAPTRASLLTGRHHLKTGVWGVHGAMDYINLDETLIGEALKNAGYSTAHFGKWHSGTTPGYNPWDRGFDLSYTTKLYTFFNTVVKKNGLEMQSSGWIEDWLADRIIEYLQDRTKDGNPFFILWTPMSIHKGRKYDSEWYEDFIAPGGYYSKFAGKVTRDLNHVFAALAYFDTVLGKVLNNLDKLGLGSDTVVMFFGDNGPLLYNTDHQNGYARDQRVPSQMKEQKGFIEENGIRNFLFVRGTNRFPAGKKVYENIGVIDIYPTMLDLAKASPPSYNKPIDGVSFSPLLCEKSSWQHAERTLYFHEILKNTLGTDQIPDLTPKRFTDRSQKMLQFQGGGSWGQGFRYTSGLRWKQWKYLKTDLYDLDAQNYKEFDWNKLYWTDKKLDEQLSDKLQGRLVTWWNSVLADPGAFQKPTFLIGKENISPVMAVGAIERTKFDVTVGDKSVSGFKNSGDFFACKVRIVQSGWYRVNFLYGWNYYRGAYISISVGKNWQVQSGEATSLTKKISNNGPLSFGKVYLQATEKGSVEDEVHVKLSKRDFNDGGHIFWWIEAIEFIKTS